MADFEARRLLKATSTTGLLQSFAALTHQIHAAEDNGSVSESHAIAKRERISGLRAQRDQIKDEILRRTGDLE